MCVVNGFPWKTSTYCENELCFRSLFPNVTFYSAYLAAKLFNRREINLFIGSHKYLKLYNRSCRIDVVYSGESCADTWIEKEVT